MSTTKPGSIYLSEGRSLLDRKSRNIPEHLWVTTLNFFVLSMMLAYLVGMGQRSNRIPILVAIIIVLALVNTDWLGWFRLNRYVAYFGMISGAGLAIFEFFYGRQIDQLYSVANLLVYVQIPLMFQKKDQRIFDHWGIFLMLEMVVASLLNDNLLFGILLIPVLIVGCSAMMSLATYSSIQQGGTSAPESAGWIPDALRWLGQEQSWARRPSGIRLMGLKSQHITSSSGYFTRLGWADGLPVGLIIAMFALIYFFALPRLHTGAYEGLGRAKPLVGFSGIISLDDVGELMSNSDIALRVTMTDLTTKRSFQPVEPPYIRGIVADTYDGTGRWHSTQVDEAFNISSVERLPSVFDVAPELKQFSDPVEITVTEQAQLDDAEFSIPPFFSVNPVSDLKFNRRDWSLVSHSADARSIRKRRKYEFETRSYFEGKQNPFLIDNPIPRNPDEDGIKDSDWSLYRKRLTAIDPNRFAGLIKLCNVVIEEKSERSDLEKVLLLEDFLATSSDFKYSLLPSVDRANGVDPIEDFAVRHRTGHCQFFAATLAMMLRSQGIPSRIVLGFRPPEYNDVGKFLVVRQNHAHAWVEAWIAQNELVSTTVTAPKWVKEGAWIRLDPTPPGEGSNAGGSLKSSRGQAFQAVEQLWEDLVIQMDSSRQSDAASIFAMVGNGSVGVFLRSLERRFLQLQTQNLDNVSIETNRWFSWKSGLMAMFLAATLAVAAQFRSPIRDLFTSRFLSQGNQSAANTARVLPLFFLRLNFSLSRLGLKRSISQTPLEFAKESEKWLQENDFKNRTEEGEPLLTLDSIINTFYNYRYGNSDSPTPTELESIDKKIVAIERFSAHHRKYYLRS
ncbi:MAG: DUF3488 and transglutaminase-like domain-containing protein [Planctomycetota bacterium]|nr:DUF3488 and transglutaminase-like domain-containing protein [Planctomycetota bacterium]